MDNREKIAHLLRRFGFGASQKELDELSKFSVEEAVNRLVDYEVTDEQFPYTLSEFLMEKNGNVAVDAYRPAILWTLRMLLTRRPLQEKLTLFWHDHFAVSGTKVEFGPALEIYLTSIRKHANGNFRNLLGAMLRDPSMLIYLDNSLSAKGKPNENLGRELLELFTMGSGYTEQDIKEVSRALTGRLTTFAVAEGKGKHIYEQIKECVLEDRPMVGFAIYPDIHDSGDKTVLGEKGTFDDAQVLDILVKRPETARNITTKLWSYFAYDKPEAKVQEKLIKTYFDGGYDIKKILKAMTQMDEFWSERAQRKIVKSPADFVIPIARQLEIRDFVLAMRPKDPTPLAPANDIALAVGYGLMLSMQLQGMQLLFPPNVGGWEWGDKWVNSATMTERMKVAELLFGDDTDQRLAPHLANKIITEFAPKNPADIASALNRIFDTGLSAEKLKLIEAACSKEGGVDALKEPKKASALLKAACKLIYGAPEFQFC